VISGYNVINDNKTSNANNPIWAAVMSLLPDAAPSTKSRREERRDATLAEIKQAAWQQLATGGAENLSLRAISRQMRVSSPALFRYFPNREALLNALSQDAFRACNERMLQAVAETASEADDLPAAGRLPAAARLPETDDRPEADNLPAAAPAAKIRAAKIRAACLAFRAWAVEAPEQFALVYGAPVSGYSPDWPLFLKDAAQGLEIIIQLVADAWRSGALTRIPALSELDPLLAGQLQAVCQARGYDAPPAVLYLAISGWTRLSGILSLEIFGRLSPLLPDAEALYRQEVNAILQATGYPDSAADRTEGV
jgi:AcrR family transcriptional regulator